MLELFTVLFFGGFLAFVAIAPNQVIQIFLMFTWIGMLLTTVYQFVKALLS